MKWIIGGLLLAVVAAVYKRPELMSWVVYCFAALFAFMGAAIFFAFTRSKHHGLLLLGFTYLSGAVAAVLLTEWWPLVAALVIAWALRAMGMDPTPSEVAGAQTPGQGETAPPADSDKKS